MDKHAYCIIAHNEPKILSKLVEMVDDLRNDIFILIDLKANLSDFQFVKSQKSKLFILDKRIDIRWGDISLMKAELMVLETAYCSDSQYKYYHLLSGVDLPLKSQDYIHDFMSKNYPKEFVGYIFDIMPEQTRYYHLFLNHLKNDTLYSRVLNKASRFLCYLQKTFGYHRTFDVEIKKGCNWVSITNEFCEYLLARKSNILNQLRFIPCVDEIFIQTVLWNSPFKRNIYDMGNEYHSCMRFIDWNRGNPYVWNEEDFELLIKSDKLFARKFSSKNSLIIEKIYSYVLKNKISIPK